MGKAQKPETMSAEVRRYVCSLPAPNAQRLRLATRVTTRRFSTHFRCAHVNRHQGMQTLRQWQCRVSVQRETATSDDNLSNLRCWRNAGAHKQSTWATGDSGVTLQPEARLDCQVRNANKQTAFQCCATPTRPLCELQMDAPSPELCFLNELGDVRGLKCSRAFSAFLKGRYSVTPVCINSTPASATMGCTHTLMPTVLQRRLVFEKP